MYNTINPEFQEAGMDITSIGVNYLSTGRHDRTDYDNVRHIKSLPWLSVVQAEVGSYTIKLGDSDGFEVPCGGFFIAPGQVTQYITHHSAENGRMAARWVFLETVINGSYRLDTLFEFPQLIASEPEKRLLNERFDELFRASDICDRMSETYRLIKLLLGFGSEKKRMRGDLALVSDYIARHYDSDIDVGKLASIAHMSESNFYAAFRATFGLSPMAYLNRVRLSTASVMLTESDRPISEIAAGVGFLDPLYFSRQFKKLFAVPPREYRRRG